MSGDKGPRTLRVLSRFNGEQQTQGLKAEFDSLAGGVGSVAIYLQMVVDRQEIRPNAFQSRFFKKETRHLDFYVK